MGVTDIEWINWNQDTFLVLLLSEILFFYVLCISIVGKLLWMLVLHEDFWSCISWKYFRKTLSKHMLLWLLSRSLFILNYCCSVLGRSPFMAGVYPVWRRFLHAYAGDFLRRLPMITQEWHSSHCCWWCFRKSSAHTCSGDVLGRVLFTLVMLLIRVLSTLVVVMF